MLVTKCVRDVQELKTHASESGQMHAQHLAICGQVIKKKMHRVSAQNESAGNGPRWCLKDTPTAAIFCCKGSDQHVRVRSKMAFLGLEKQLQLFCILCTNIAALSFFQQDFYLEIKHMNRPLHLYMLEMFTPYLFKSNRRKTSQEHPSARERSSVLKTLKTVGTMYISPLQRK